MAKVLIVKGAAASARKLRVVIVDDASMMRSLISETLGDLRAFDVVGQAKDGSEGLQMIKELKPDVATLDLRMPGMTGLEVLERLRSEKDSPNVIVFAALENEDMRTKCLELGANAVFDKANEFEQFRAMLAQLHLR